MFRSLMSSEYHQKKGVKDFFFCDVASFLFFKEILEEDIIRLEFAFSVKLCFDLNNLSANSSNLSSVVD